MGLLILGCIVTSKTRIKVEIWEPIATILIIHELPVIVQLIVNIHDLF